MIAPLTIDRVQRGDEIARAERLAEETYGDRYPSGYARAYRDDRGIGVSYFTGTDAFDGEICCRFDGTLEQIS